MMNVKAPWVIGAVFALVVLVVIAYVLVPDNSQGLVMIIGIVTSTIVGLFAYGKSDQTHTTTNSKMDKLLDLNKKASFAEGKLEGKEEEKSEGS